MRTSPPCISWMLAPALLLGLCASCALEDPSDNASTTSKRTSPPDDRDMRPPVAGADMPDAKDMRPAEVDMAQPLPPGEDITIGTFNVERLFDQNCDSGRCDGGEFEGVTPRLNLNSRFDRLEAAVRAMDADTIVLQEIETEALFDELAERLKDLYPVKVFGETRFAASLDIGVLSKGTLDGTTAHRQEGLDGFKDSFVREFLEVRVTLGPKKLVFFGAHFLSKRAEDTPRRLAEARTAGRIASDAAKAHPDALIVLAGDLNDTPDSQTLRNLQDKGLEAPSTALDPSIYYTHKYAGAPQIIDHVLFIPRPDVQIHRPPVTVFRDKGRDGFGGSDHCGLRATFRIIK